VAENGKVLDRETPATETSVFENTIGRIIHVLEVRRLQFFVFF